MALISGSLRRVSRRPYLFENLVKTRLFSARRSSSGNNKKPGNHYESLGLNPKATKSEIKDAFFSISKRYHPDTNPSDPNLAAVKFQRASEAYEILGDESKKKEYDRSIGYEDGVPIDRTGAVWRPGVKKRPFVNDLGRTVDVDMSENGMNRAWELYRQRWKAEEERISQLEETKLAFRIEMDRRRAAIDQLTPEEKQEYYEACRLFKHPNNIRADKEVIRSDKETFQDSLLSRFLDKIDVKVQQRLRVWDVGIKRMPDQHPETDSNPQFNSAPYVSRTKRKRPLGRTMASDPSSASSSRTNTSKQNINEVKTEDLKDDPKGDFDVEEIIKASGLGMTMAEVEKYQRIKEAEIRRAENIKREREEKRSQENKQWFDEYREECRAPWPEDILTKDTQDEVDLHKTYLKAKDAVFNSDAFGDGGPPSSDFSTRNREEYRIATIIVLTIVGVVAAVSIAALYVQSSSQEKELELRLKMVEDSKNKSSK